MKKGMTLIEILTASVILVIVIAPSLYITNHSYRNVLENNARNAASKLLNNILEDISVSPQRIEVLKYIRDNEFTNYNYSEVNFNVKSGFYPKLDYSVTVELDTVVTEGLYSNMVVSATAEWEYLGKQRSLSMFTITR